MSRMSELDMDRQVLDSISEAMKEPAQTAEIQIERRIDFLVRELDEFCAMANEPETRDLVASEATAIGQVQFRASLILSFLKAAEVPKFRMVSNA